MDATDIRSSEHLPRPLCLVTGGHAGLGYELAKAFITAGCDLVLAGADLCEQELAAAELEPHGQQPTIYCMGVDLTNPNGPALLHRKLRALAEPIDIFVANASVGAWGDFGRAESLHDELALAQANTLSVLHLTRLVAGDMSARGHGQILVATSRSASACAFDTVQDATRAFATTFADGLAHELSGKAPGVTTLAPEVDVDGVVARLRDPVALTAVARELSSIAAAERPATPPILRSLAMPDRVSYLFGGSAELPSA